MSVASRQNKSRKDASSPTHQRRGGGPSGAWRGANNNPSSIFNNSPSGNPHRMSMPPQGVPMNAFNSSPPPNNAPINPFPPLSSNPNTSSPGPAGPTLPPSRLIGSMLVVNTRSGSRHQGILTAPEPQQPAGIALKDARDVVNPGAPVVDLFFIPSQQIANWQPESSTQQPLNLPAGRAFDSFRTDGDISGNNAPRRERELQTWKPEGAPVQQPQQQEGAAFAANHVNGSWDQFAANEKLFGVTTNYDEELYTTKLDRSTADYRDKERRAQQIANEINGVATSNPHVREERGLDDSGLNEEDKYGAVVRGPNAYVPPARRQETNGVSKPPTPGTSSKPQVSKPAPAPAPAPTSTPPAGARPPATTNTSTPNVPKVSLNAPDGSTAPPPKANATNATPNATGSTESSVVASFKDFVSNEKQRLAQKKQAIQKSEKDKRLADLIKFSTTFKLNKPIPADLVPILTKDEEKKKELVEKSLKDAESTNARAIAQVPPTVSVVNGAAAAITTGRTPAAAAAASNGAAPSARQAMVVQAIPPFKGNKAAASANKPAAAAAPVKATNSSGSINPAASAPKPAAEPTKKAPIRMVIQNIPAFDPNRRRTSTTDGAPMNGAKAAAPAVTNNTTQKTGANAVPASPTGSGTSSNSNAFKLNVNASSFRPVVNTSALKPAVINAPASATSPKAKADDPAAAQPPNPFFGNKPIKKGTAVHIKDDFNPFKFAKVSEASVVPYNWPFTGKRYMAMFAPLPHGPPPQPAPPPPSYEEDSAVQAQAQAQAARMGYGMMYAYPYQYPGQPQQPHMMMANQAPPGGYMQPQFMPHMPYPPPMPPNAPPGMYGPPQMGGMQPPAGGYMAPPQQGGYPPNGGPRGSMPPTPIPQHAYATAYHHQSPQMTHAHAVPYSMMMPSGGPPPHGYDGQQAPPGPMGVGH